MMLLLTAWQQLNALQLDGQQLNPIQLALKSLDILTIIYDHDNIVGISICQCEILAIWFQMKYKSNGGES